MLEGAELFFTLLLLGRFGSRNARRLGVFGRVILKLLRAATATEEIAPALIVRIHVVGSCLGYIKLRTSQHGARYRFGR